MDIPRKVRLASWGLSIVAITFGGMAAVHFFAGAHGFSGGVDAGQAQYAQVLATLSVAFGLVAVALPASMRT